MRADGPLRGRRVDASGCHDVTDAACASPPRTTCRTGPSPSPKPSPVGVGPRPPRPVRISSRRSPVYAIPAAIRCTRARAPRTSRVARVRRSGVPRAVASAAIVIGMPLPLRATSGQRRRGRRARARTRHSPSRRPWPGARGERRANSPHWRGVRMTNPARTWCDLADGRSRCPNSSRRETGSSAVGWRTRTRSRGVAQRPRRSARHRPDPHRAVHARSTLGVAEGVGAPRHRDPRPGCPDRPPNVEIRRPDGRFVARVDLLFEEYGEILEYHGDHHRTDRRQWRRDRTREADLESTRLPRDGGHGRRPRQTRRRSSTGSDATSDAVAGLRERRVGRSSALDGAARRRRTSKRTAGASRRRRRPAARRRGRRPRVSGRRGS